MIIINRSKTDIFITMRLEITLINYLISNFLNFKFIITKLLIANIISIIFFFFLIVINFL